MTGALVAAALVLAAPDDNIPPGQGPEWGKAAPIGLLIILLLGLALFFLIKNMNKQFRKVPASFDPPEPGAQGESGVDAGPGSDAGHDVPGAIRDGSAPAGDASPGDGAEPAAADGVEGAGVDRIGVDRAGVDWAGPGSDTEPTADARSGASGPSHAGS